jgi:site-specific DNA-cytosine methylase
MPRTRKKPLPGTVKDLPMSQPAATVATGSARPQSRRAEEIQAILERNQEMMRQLQTELNVSAAGREAERGREGWKEGARFGEGARGRTRERKGGRARPLPAGVRRESMRTRARLHALILRRNRRTLAAAERGATAHPRRHQARVCQRRCLALTGQPLKTREMVCPRRAPKTTETKAIPGRAVACPYPGTDEGSRHQCPHLHRLHDCLVPH